MEASIVENFEKETKNVENHNHYHKGPGQAFNMNERDDNDDQTFKDKNCVHHWLFPFCWYLFYILLLTWEGKNVIVKVNVTDAIEKALIKHLQTALQSFVGDKDKVSFYVETLSFSCEPMEACHEEHVEDNNNHHRVKLTITKAVRKKHKDKESGSYEADTGSQENQTTPEVGIKVKSSCFL